MNDKAYYDYQFYDFDLTQAEIHNQKQGLEAFLDFLPIKKLAVTLGEGNTPLTKAHNISKKYGHQVFIKHEHLNPTGSFKDRESVISINWLLENKKKNKKICIASSGNAAVSTAAYANLAQFDCTCFVPQNTSTSKKELIGLFNATCKEIEGNYEQVYRYLADQGDKFGINVTAGIDSLRVEGNKTIAYEIFQSGVTPDCVIVPCGNGGNLAGIWKGFDDLFQKKLISKMPRMIAVQIKNAAPLALALEQNQDYCIAKDIPDSIAEGIIAEESYCSPKAIQAIKESQGTVIQVTDPLIHQTAQEMIELESLILEPTSYAAFAALSELPQVKPNQTVVVIATGSGSKMIEEIKEL